jgi:hypothetical protein
VTRLIFTLLCLFLSVGFSRGQAYLADTAFVAEAQKNAVNLYTSRLGVVSNVYNGNEYSEYRPQNDEHPYLTQDWNYGRVNYGGEQYESVPLMLDLSKDELISMYTSGNAIQMIREKVSSFQIEDRIFVRLANEQVTAGFYELLYDGKVKFYAKRKKTLYKKEDGTELLNTFEESNSYYILKDGKYHNFRSRGSLLKILDDHKADVKKIIREQKTPFRFQREKITVRALGYYDQITR